MTWSNTTTLSVVELGIYLVLLPLLIFSACKHRLSGFLSHLYLFIFVTLRIAADIVAISDRNEANGTSTAGAIVNSIGLSPLLLATVAVLNQARSYINAEVQDKKQKFENTMLDLVMHIVVMTGLALVATGTANAAKDTSETSIHKDHRIAEVGAFLLFISWVISCWWAYMTCQLHRRSSSTGPIRVLLMAIVVSLPFTGARVVYTIVYTFDYSANLGPTTGPFALKLIFVFLVQLLAAVFLQFGLFTSRNRPAKYRTLVPEHNTGAKNTTDTSTYNLKPISV